MTRVIQDLWIIKNGLVLFKRVYDEKLDSDLFGAMMTALRCMGDEMGLQRGLSKFEVDNKKFFISTKNEIHFIGNGDSRVKDKKIMNELEIVKVIFFDSYDDQMLAEWNGGAVDQFENFGEKIKYSLEQAIDRFKSVYG